MTMTPNKRGWALYPESTLQNKNQAFDWLQHEAAACGIDLGIYFFEELLLTADGRRMRHGQELPPPDFVLMRGYENLLSTHFELEGIPVFNTTASMIRSRDKMLTHQLLAQAGIPTPTTCYLSGGNYTYDSLCGMFGNRRFVVKNIEGSKGENVHLIGSELELHAALTCEGARCLAQEYIAASHGRDLRVWVIDNQAVASVLRYSDSDFRSNFAQGGHAAPYELSAEAASLAVRAAQTLGLDFAGVDLLFATEGYTVCEVNGNAGFRTLSLLPESPNLPALLFRHIGDRIG